jgi:hypothetical protein
MTTGTERTFTTEWAEADIRVIRRGERFELEIRALDDVGCHMHHTISLEEREAGDLRDMWLEIES